MNKVINLLGTMKSTVLSRFNTSIKFPCVILEPITEELENKIDAIIKYGGSVKLDSKHIVTKTDIYVYGDINLNNKSDIEYLSKFKRIILNPYTMTTFIPSSFNYKLGTYLKVDGLARGSNFQGDFLKWFKYNYCIIGKPKKIIIYHYPNRR